MVGRWRARVLCEAKVRTHELRASPACAPVISCTPALHAQPCRHILRTEDSRPASKVCTPEGAVREQVCDLSLLTVDEEDFWAPGLMALHFVDVPQLQ